MLKERQIPVALVRLAGIAGGRLGGPTEVIVHFYLTDWHPPVALISCWDSEKAGRWDATDSKYCSVG